MNRRSAGLTFVNFFVDFEMSVTIEDCVHGDIQLPGYVVPFIESKEFKRLMNLKQLGEHELKHE